MTTTLTSAEKKQIKGIMKLEGWDAVMRFVGLKLDQWQAESVTGQSAFEELRALHKRDGKIEGVTEIFDQLEKQGFDD